MPGVDIPPPCLHVLTTSPKVCDRCHDILPNAAREAARLRGRHATDASGTVAPTLIGNRGETTLTLVRGDEVREVVVTTRARRSLEYLQGHVCGEGECGCKYYQADPSHITTDLVAEVVRGCSFADGTSVARGDLFEVRAKVGEAVRLDGGDVATAVSK